MKIVFSWDDGALEDLKLFEMHEKYSVPGMFFVPTKNKEGRRVLTPEMIRENSSNIISFGGHTENHTYLTEIPLSDVEDEVRTNQIYLEDILGYEIKDFCLPGGRYTKEVLDRVYKYFTTIRTADTMNFRYSGGVLKPTIHFFPRGKKSLFYNGIKNKSFKQVNTVIKHIGQDYFSLIDSLINEQDENSVIVIWGHSWELEKYNLWEQLEKIMKSEAVQNHCCKYSELFLEVDK